MELAKAGEEVLIARGRTPVAKIVPIEPRKFALGLQKGRLDGTAPDFQEPLAAPLVSADRCLTKGRH
nr:type II toxin-antitoxin system prevent-host-death family antitoxin [Pseudorhizobium endolithicum]